MKKTTKKQAAYAMASGRSKQIAVLIEAFPKVTPTDRIELLRKAEELTTWLLRDLTEARIRETIDYGQATGTER